MKQIKNQRLQTYLIQFLVKLTQNKYDLGYFLNFRLDTLSLISFYIFIFVLVVVIIDYFYQKYEHTKNLMMQENKLKIQSFKLKNV